MCHCLLNTTLDALSHTLSFTPSLRLILLSLLHSFVHKQKRSTRGSPECFRGRYITHSTRTPRQVHKLSTTLFRCGYIFIKTINVQGLIDLSSGRWLFYSPSIYPDLKYLRLLHSNFQLFYQQNTLKKQHRK